MGLVSPEHFITDVAVLQPIPLTPPESPKLGPLPEQSSHPLKGDNAPLSTQ